MGKKHFKKSTVGKKPQSNQPEIIPQAKEHLPLYGVGPVIVFGQIVITAAAIIVCKFWKTDLPDFGILKTPIVMLGIFLIAIGVSLDYQAKTVSRLFDHVKGNRLITDGIYGIVRHPVYSAALFGCTGAILIANCIPLLVIPVICWLFMTVMLICTEEKWLIKQYGQEYIDYCKQVNRCIPRSPMKLTELLKQ